MFIADDFAAIKSGLDKANGDAPSGTFYGRDADNKPVLVESGHDWADPFDNVCPRCEFTRSDLEDGIAPKVCPGKPPAPGDVIYENSLIQIIYIGRGHRYQIDKRADLEPQIRALHAASNAIGGFEGLSAAKLFEYAALEMGSMPGFIRPEIKDGKLEAMTKAAYEYEREWTVFRPKLVVWEDAEQSAHNWWTGLIRAALKAGHEYDNPLKQVTYRPESAP